MQHVLVNALSMGSGGGFTVGRELVRNLALVRPRWRLSCALVQGHKLHEQMREANLPGNCELIWAPAKLIGRTDRARWEKRELTALADSQAVDAVVQLNGMLVPGMRPPTLCHMQDPWPYRPEAWEGIKDRIIAGLKRREHRFALRNAAAFTWTSDYLRRLICEHHRIWPKISEVVYNGVPDSWIHRANESPPLESRPNELITVSNVNRYKRQHLVIEAMPALLKRPGLENLVYRIVGDCPPDYVRHLEALIDRLGLAQHVRLEGRVSDETVMRLYAQARCFVLMSVCESFGIPAIEAMSFGVPVVAADCCAIPEVCGDAADLAPVDNVQALSEILARILLGPAHAAELRQRGAQRVASFNWTTVATRIAEILEQIAASGPVANG